MNLRIKRCLFGLMTWAAMTGVSVAQQNESEGTVQLGQAPAVVNAAPDDTEGAVRVGSATNQPLPEEMAPLGTGPDQPAPGSNFGYTSVDRVFQPRFNVDSRGGGLYGYNAGYTNIGMFVPFQIETDESIFFIDTRALVTYDGGGGANLGLGWRWWMSDIDRIVGLSAWYDNANGGIGSNFNQVGLSFESLGRFVDYRVNGYIPIGNVNHAGYSSVSPTASFQQNYLGFLRTTQTAQAFTGFDAELGGPLPILGRYGMNAYLGGYYFTGAGQQAGNFTGVSGRFLSQINEDVSFGVQVTNDRMFGLNTQFQVFVTLPDGRPGQWMRNFRVQDRLTQSVFRQYRVMTHIDAIKTLDKAIDPKTNKPYFVAQIDPNATTTGNGTIESPFQSIAAYNAQTVAHQKQYDMLYVRPGTPQTAANLDTNSTLTLYSNQRLLSTSVNHTFTTTTYPGQTFTLPGYTGGSLTSLFNSSLNPNNAVVTLAAGNTGCNEVSGFDINGTSTNGNVTLTRNGIVGTNNQFVLINNNNVHDAVNGVQLTNLSGTVTAGTAAQVYDNTFTNNTNDGFRVVNTGAKALDFIAQRNTFSNNGGDGLHLEANAGSVIGGIIGGVDTAFNAGPPVVPAVLRGNTFSTNTGNGMALLASGGTLNFLSPPGTTGAGIINNSFISNAGDGLHIATTNNSTGNFDIVSNRFGDTTIASSGNTGFGVNLISNSGTNVINIGGATTDLGNMFAGNVTGGVNFALTGTNLTTTNIQNNTIIFNSLVGGSVILPGFNQNTLAANDDLSTGLVPIGFNADFFGVNFNQLFVNNNGNVTLNTPLATFTPFPIVSNGIPMLAPFFADVDTSAGNVVSYGTGTVNGHLAFGVNWPDVRHFDALLGTNNGLPTNNFQLVLVDRSDIAPGDFDFEFNYKQIQWESGEASGSNPQGLGGSSARVGWTNGVNSSFELPGSAVNGALLDTGPAATSLVQNSLNSSLAGQYIFQVRGGVVGGTGLPGTSNGITVNVSNNAHLQTSNISDNSATGIGGYGLQVNTNGNGKVDNLTVTGNTFSQNDGGMQFNRTGNSTLQATLQNNVMNQNNFNGMSVNASGTNINGVNLALSDNTMNQNTVNGLQSASSGASIVTISSNRDNYNRNTGDNINVTTAGTSVTNLTLLNALSSNSSQNGLSATTSNSSQFNLAISSPTDPLFTGGVRTTFSNNAQNGVLLTSKDASTMNASIDKTDMSINTLDGLRFDRFDTSLVNANVTNSAMVKNLGNGLEFHGLGSDPQDPNQPFTGTPNRINLLSDQLNGNGTAGAGNGANINMLGDSELVLNATQTTFNDNAENGVRVYITPGAQFGYQLGNERSTFDGVTMTGNSANGIFVYSDLALNSQGTVTPNQADSLTYMAIVSDSGNTLIGSNALNGVLLQYPGGVHDILIGNTSPKFTTQISGNTLDGIHVDTGGIASTNLTLDGVIVGGPGATDGNGGDGVDFEVTSQYTVTDGANTFNWGFLGGGDGTLSVLNSTIEGNGANGLNLVGNALEGTAGGGVRTQNNQNIDAIGFLTVAVVNSNISHNAVDGVNVDLEGLMGTRANPVSLVFDNNLIVDNGQHGFFLQQNPATQLRNGSTFRQIQFQDPQPTNPVLPFNPNNLAGTSNWNTGDNTDLLGGAYLSNYLNLRTALNTSLVFTNNVVQFNGTQGVLNSGDGVYLRVGTNSYLAADVRNNTISGNLANDLHIESFDAFDPSTNAAILPPASVATAAPAPDVVYLDDTAQLDLRLAGNTGNTVNIVDPFYNFGGNAPGNLTPNGAFYPGELLKNNFGPNVIEPRLVQLFQVDDGANLNTVNTFSQNGVVTDLQNTFFDSEYHLRTTADPLFPNASFPLNYFASPGNPFLP